MSCASVDRSTLVRVRFRARARARVKARARGRVRVRVTVRVRDKSHLLYAHALSLLGAELLVREALTLARRLQQRRREGGLLIGTGAQHTLARLPYHDALRFADQRVESAQLRLVTRGDT